MPDSDPQEDLAEELPASWEEGEVPVLGPELELDEGNGGRQIVIDERRLAEVYRAMEAMLERQLAAMGKVIRINALQELKTRLTELARTGRPADTVDPANLPGTARDADPGRVAGEGANLTARDEPEPPDESVR